MAAEADVIVLGGGIAGAAAALASVREGAHTLLIEKESGPGGLATLGNILVYLPLCDGRGRQVMGGLPEELLHLSMKNTIPGSPRLGFKSLPECWNDPLGCVESAQNRKKHRFQSSFNPAAFLLDLEELLRREGVDIWYDTRFTGSLEEKGRISHVIVENKSGTLALSGKAFVDATGDADLCACSGEKTAVRDHNVLSNWHYLLEDGTPTLQTMSRPFSFSSGEEGCEEPTFSGHIGKDVTNHILGSRQLIRENLAEKKKTNPVKAIQPFLLPSIPSFRATRRLDNSFILNEKHLHKSLPDRIGFTGDWRQAGPVYPIPLRALQGEANNNLFAAGRCISVNRTLWDVTRVIPVCVLTGQASGTAAALASLYGSNETSFLNRLQEQLVRAGALLDPQLANGTAPSPEPSNP